MFNPAQLLLITLALPLVGAAAIAIAGRRDPVFARQSALVTALLTLLAASWLLVEFPNHAEVRPGEPFAQSSIGWLGDATGLDVRLTVALDGLSAWMFGLSALLVVTCVLVSWEAIQERAPAFFALMLLLERGMLGVFEARDVSLI